MQVLGIGEVVLDKVCLLHSYPKEGIKVEPKRIEVSIGGPVVSSLILLSKLGMECVFIASIGEDEAGLKIKDVLDKEGIKLVPNIITKTKINTVLVNSENGSRTIIKDGGKYKSIFNINEKLIESANMIIFDRHEPVAFREVISKKRPETKIVSDPSTEMSEKTIEIMQNSDYPILPVECLDKFSVVASRMVKLKCLYDKLKKTIIVTTGEHGSFIFDGINIEIMPPVDVDVVDVLGAGDIFRGAFSYGLLCGWSVRESVSFANKVAGLHCTKLGNSKAIPSKEQIDQFKKTAKCKTVCLEDILLK